MGRFYRNPEKIVTIYHERNATLSRKYASKCENSRNFYFSHQWEESTCEQYSRNFRKYQNFSLNSEQFSRRGEWRKPCNQRFLFVWVKNYWMKMHGWSMHCSNNQIKRTIFTRIFWREPRWTRFSKRLYELHKRFFVSKWRNSSLFPWKWANRKPDFLCYIWARVIKNPQLGNFLFCNGFYYCFEHLRMSNSQVWKNFSVQFYFIYVKIMNESWVVCTKWTNCIVQTNSPKTTELTFFQTTSNIRILTSLHDCIFCTRIYIPIHTTISLRKRKDIFMSFVCHHTAFYTSHNIKLLGNKIIDHMEEMPSLLSYLLQEELFRIYRDLSLFLISEREGDAYKFCLP